MRDLNDHNLPFPLWPDPALEKASASARLDGRERSDMQEVRLSNPIINTIIRSDDLATALLQVGCELPLAHHPDQCGDIVDATGRTIAMVDFNNELPDEQVEVITAIILFAVNTCADLCALGRQKAEEQANE